MLRLIAGILLAGMWLGYANAAFVSFGLNNASVPTSCLFGTALSDGCLGAQVSGITPRTTILTPQTVVSVVILTGSGYTSGGPYTWTSSGGGCSVNASGTVTVTSGYLGGAAGVTYTISNPGAGCTSVPTISIPAGASGGTNGSMHAVVYQQTPHNASTTWNMPGVDYPVGYDRTLTLKDPTIQGNLPSGATVSGSTVTIGSNNVTLNGFDFCSHSATLVISSSVTGYVVSNNSFCDPASDSQSVTLNSSTSGTVKFNDFNGGAVLGGIGSPGGQCGDGSTTCGPNGSLCCGPITSLTFEYNYCYQQDSKCWQLYGTTGGGTIVEKFNLYDTIGNCQTNNPHGPCAHGESQYFYGSNGTVNYTSEFNTFWNPFHCTVDADSTHCPGGNYANPTALAAPQADTTSIDGTTWDHNVVLMPGPNGSCGGGGNTYTAIAAMYDGQQEGGALSNVTFLTNFLDSSGGATSWYHNGGGTNLTYSGNISAVTGSACN